MIGACYDGSGINASDTLKNENFKPHVALKSCWNGFTKRGRSSPPETRPLGPFQSTRTGPRAKRRQPRQVSLFDGGMSMSNCSTRCGSGAA